MVGTLPQYALESSIANNFGVGFEHGPQRASILLQIVSVGWRPPREHFLGVYVRTGSLNHTTMLEYGHLRPTMQHLGLSTMYYLFRRDVIRYPSHVNKRKRSWPMTLRLVSTCVLRLLLAFEPQIILHPSE